MGTAYELTVDDPSLPHGEPIQIPGLGTFDNGSTVEVSDEQSDAFRAYWSRNKKLGPTLLQWAKGSRVVEVNTAQQQQQRPQQQPSPDGKNEGGDK